MPTCLNDAEIQCPYLDCAAGGGFAKSIAVLDIDVLESYVHSHIDERYGGEVEEPYREIEMWELLYGWI